MTEWKFKRGNISKDHSLTQELANFKIWKLRFCVIETKFLVLAQPYVHLQAEETKRFDLHIIQLKQRTIVTPSLRS